MTTTYGITAGDRAAFNDLVKQASRMLFELARGQEFQLPWRVEMTDADGERVCEILFSEDVDGKLVSSSLRKRTVEIAKFPVSSTLTDASGKRQVNIVMQPPTPETKGAA
jgi:hypothetical protein